MSEQEYRMKSSDTDKLEAIKARLLEGMTDYIADGEDGLYSKDDIQKCDDILRDFMKRLGGLEDSAPETTILHCVKKAVLDLNTLNDSVGGSLIETDQREDLCEYLLLAAQSAGLKREDDVTEEWREW
jgi:hypothetical protein